MKTGSTIIELAHEAMATTFRLRLAGGAERLARQAAAAAWNELARLESLLSRYVDGSDVSRINHAPAGDPVRVNADTMQCLIAAVDMASRTEGAFNSMSGAWSNPRKRADSSSPSGPGSADLADLVLSAGDLTVTRTRDDSRLDLGGIGKGFAVDKLVAVLRDWELPAACLDAGGSTTFAFGQPERGSPWQVRIGPQLMPLEDASCAGSGTAVKGDHIVDGRTGSPCTTMTPVWSYAPTATEADALSTAFFVFSRDEIETFCAQHRQYGAARITPEDTIHAFGWFKGRIGTGRGSPRR